MIAPTQSGKTVWLLTALSDAIDQDPGPLLYVLPDEKLCRKAYDEKLKPLIERTPDFEKHIVSRVKNFGYSGISLDHMNINPAWAGSLASLSMTAYKRVILDEVRLMPLTQGEESNAIKLANDRLTTYKDYGIAQGYMASSPSVEGDLLHQQLSIPGTLFLSWAVPCPSCELYQVLTLRKNMKDFKKDPKCVCVHCGCKFEDVDKKKSWNNKGKYVVMELVGSKWEPKIDQYFNYEDYTRVFFHYSSLVSPFRSFFAIAKEYLETKNKLHDFRNFVQCWLAEFWIDDQSKADEFSLKERRNSELEKGDVPNFVRVITAGIDTQDDGFYVVVRGWGAERLTVLIDEFFIPCKIGLTTWKDIQKILKRDIFDRVYSGWKIALAAIDTGGHRTREIYTAASNFNRLILIKGAHENQNTTIQYNKDLNLYLVRTIEYLDETDLKACKPEFVLPRNTSEDYINQFCNVRRTSKRNNMTGEVKVIWKKIGQFDFRMSEVYAFVAMDINTDRGVLRAEIEKPDFKFNPFSEEKALMENQVNTQPIIEEMDFNIDGYNW